MSLIFSSFFDTPKLNISSSTFDLFPQTADSYRGKGKKSRLAEGLAIVHLFLFLEHIFNTENTQ